MKDSRAVTVNRAIHLRLGYRLGRFWGLIWLAALLNIFRLVSEDLIGSTPFGARDLLLWFDELPTDNKSLIVGSAIALVGIYAAYRTAIETWRYQKLNELRLQSAERIEAYTHKSRRDFLDAEIYCRFLEKFIETDPADTEELQHLIDYLLFKIDTGVEAFTACTHDIDESWTVYMQELPMVRTVGGADGVWELIISLIQIDNRPLTQWMPDQRLTLAENHDVMQLFLESIKKFRSQAQAPISDMAGAAANLLSLMRHEIAPYPEQPSFSTKLATAFLAGGPGTGGRLLAMLKVTAPKWIKRKFEARDIKA